MRLLIGYEADKSFFGPGLTCKQRWEVPLLKVERGTLWGMEDSAEVEVCSVRAWQFSECSPQTSNTAFFYSVRCTAPDPKYVFIDSSIFVSIHSLKLDP